MELLIQTILPILLAVFIISILYFTYKIILPKKAFDFVMGIPPLKFIIIIVAIIAVIIFQNLTY